MTTTLFTHWYKDIFIPAVRSRQEEDGVSGPVLLVLDNCSAHPAEADLNAIAEGFAVAYLPPDVTSLIQPMDQGPLRSQRGGTGTKSNQ